MKVKRLIRRFQAKSDDGQIFEVFEYQNFVVVSDLNTGRVERPGMKELITRDGQAVNFISDGEYEIVSLFGSIRIRSI